MLKSTIKLQIEKEDRKYTFECEPNSSLGEIYDSLIEMVNFVMGKMREAQPQKPEVEEMPEKDETDGEREC